MADPGLSRGKIIAFSDSIRDQDYALLSTGEILAAHGELHPSGFIVGELAFTPDPKGDRTILGSQYRKAYTRQGRGIPEAARHLIRDEASTPHHRSRLFAHKSIVDVRRVISVIPRDVDFSSPLDLHEPLAQAAALIREIEDRLPSSLVGCFIGMTGAARLETNRVEPPHDIDLTISGPKTRVNDFGASLARLAQVEESLRVFEHGKSWRIRLQLSNGLLCPFFSYTDGGHSLDGISGEEVIDDYVAIEGRVLELLDPVTIPVVLDVEVISTNAPEKAAPGSIVRIAISHLRGRGDFALGDHGYFAGALVEMAVGQVVTPTLLVTDGTNSILLTPPWEPYDNATRQVPRGWARS